MSIIKTNPEICEPSLVLNDNVAWALAEGDHRRVCLEQNPLIQLRTPEKDHSSRKLRTECLEAASAARPGQRDRLRDFKEIFHKIRTLRTGFEV